MVSIIYLFGLASVLLFVVCTVRGLYLTFFCGNIIVLARKLV